MINPRTKVFVNSIQNQEIIHIHDNTPIINPSNKIAIVYMKNAKQFEIINKQYIQKIYILYGNKINAIHIENNPSLEDIYILRGDYYDWNGDNTVYRKENSIEITNCPSMKVISIDTNKRYYSFDISRIMDNQ